MFHANGKLVQLIETWKGGYKIIFHEIQKLLYVSKFAFHSELKQSRQRCLYLFRFCYGSMILFFLYITGIFPGWLEVRGFIVCRRRFRIYNTVKWFHKFLTLMRFSYSTLWNLWRDQETMGRVCFPLPQFCETTRNTTPVTVTVLQIFQTDAYAQNLM